MHFFSGLLLATLCGTTLARPTPQENNPTFGNTNLEVIMWGTVERVMEAHINESCNSQMLDHLNELLTNRTKGSAVSLNANSRCVDGIAHAQLLPVLRCSSRSYERKIGNDIYCYTCSNVTVEVEVWLLDGTKQRETIQMGCYCTRDIPSTDDNAIPQTHVS